MFAQFWLFFPEFVHFWCTFYTPKKCGGVPKLTNIRYDYYHCLLSSNTFSLSFNFAPCQCFCLSTLYVFAYIYLSTLYVFRCICLPTLYVFVCIYFSICMYFYALVFQFFMYLYFFVFLICMHLYDFCFYFVCICMDLRFYFVCICLCILS